jgi:hypothetical protein
MKKSLLALLLAMMSLFSATLVYADEAAASDDSMATVEPSVEEPLPPLMDESAK